LCGSLCATKPQRATDGAQLEHARKGHVFHVATKQTMASIDRHRCRHRHVCPLAFFFSFFYMYIYISIFCRVRP